MSPVRRGDVSEHAVLLALLKSGKTVLKPVSSDCKYDLAIDDSGSLVRIQCKTGRYDAKREAIVFATCSQDVLTKERRDYRGLIEYFGVYCREFDSVYLVPVDIVGARLGYLRVSEATVGTRMVTRWAKDFEITC